MRVPDAVGLTLWELEARLTAVDYEQRRQSAEILSGVAGFLSDKYRGTWKDFHPHHYEPVTETETCPFDVLTGVFGGQ